MPVPVSKSTGSLVKTLPRAKAPVMNLGPARMSNAKRAQLGLQPNPSSAQKIKMASSSKSAPKINTYKGK
jgi:hypothetical protein